jgi:hypothetical protein
VTDQRSGPWVLTETNVNGNPTQARIRYGVPLIVPGAAADAEPTRQWHELIVDVRQLAPYRLLPPRSDEQAADNITTLCLRQDDWTPEHELIISRRTGIVLASTPPKLRDKLRRELDKMINKASEDNAAARAAREEKEKKKKQQELELQKKKQQELDAEKIREEEQAKMKKHEENKKEAAKKREFETELISIQIGPGASQIVKGMCRDGKTRSKRVQQLGVQEKRLLSEWRKGRS